MRAAIALTSGGKPYFMHLGNLYVEATYGRAGKLRKERILTLAFEDAATVGEQPFILCTDSNLGSETSRVIEEAEKHGWVDLGKRFAEAEGPEMTYGKDPKWNKQDRGKNITRPDRIFANAAAAALVTSFEVIKTNRVPNHLPLKITIDAERISEAIRVVKQPKAFPVEDAPAREEEEKTRRAIQIVKESREELELARTNANEAWGIARMAERYIAWLCTGAGWKSTGERGRGTGPKIEETGIAVNTNGNPDDALNQGLMRLENAKQRAEELLRNFEVHGENIMNEEGKLIVKAKMMRLWKKVREDAVKKNLHCMNAECAKSEVPCKKAVVMLKNCWEAIEKKVKQKNNGNKDHNLETQNWTSDKKSGSDANGP